MCAASVSSAVRLTDKVTKDLICSKKELKNATLIGGGSFSRVFSIGPDSVIKVTADKLHLAYLHHPFYASPHRPYVQGQPDFLGEMSNGQPLFCQPIERLTPLAFRSAQYNLAAKICRIVNRHIHNVSPYCGYFVTKTIVQELHQSEVPSCLIEFLSRVLTFDRQYSLAEFDFTPRNFMVRPQTGELVLSDPVYDLELIMSVRGVTQTREKLGYKSTSRWF